MRRVFKGGALVALIAILIAPAVYADDPSDPVDPPSVRIRPPTGIAGEARLAPPTGVTTQGRISPPIGGQARIGPPGGITAPEPPTAFELFWIWLRARIGPPTG